MILFQTLLSPNNPRLNSINEASLLNGLFKVMFLLSIVFYIIFAVIVIRQVQIMKNTLITPVSPLILLLSILHLILAIAILFLFIIIL